MRMSGLHLEVARGEHIVHIGKDEKKARHTVAESILESGALQFPFITQLK